MRGRRVFELLLTVLSLNQGNCFSQPRHARDSVSEYPDMLYEYRFAVLDKKTPLDIEFNPQVKKYIELYTRDRRNEVQKVLGLSKLYFPVFEFYLDKYNLPLELKYLSVVESGLDPLARSSSGAVGLWQFLLPTSKMFDLKVTSYIDERCNVYKSTDAACRYFRYLYETFHNWDLVLAAYNGGPGVVRNAIARSGGKTDLWELLPYLPEQTQNYVPAFLAMDYTMNYAKTYRLEPQKPRFSYQNTDTLYISYQINFSQIAENLKISEEQIRFLNPEYKLNIIPETGEKQLLILPSNLITTYLKFENRILASSPDRDSTSLKNQHVRKDIYIVRKGDFLHKIAMKFNCSLTELKQWNKLKSDSITPGEAIIIWVSDQPKPSHRPDMF